MLKKIVKDIVLSAAFVAAAAAVPKGIELYENYKRKKRKISYMEYCALTEAISNLLNYKQGDKRCAPPKSLDALRIYEGDSPLHETVARFIEAAEKVLFHPAASAEDIEKAKADLIEQYNKLQDRHFGEEFAKDHYWENRYTHVGVMSEFLKQNRKDSKQEDNVNAEVDKPAADSTIKV